MGMRNKERDRGEVRIVRKIEGERECEKTTFQLPATICENRLERLSEKWMKKKIRKVKSRRSKAKLGQEDYSKWQM